MVPYSVDPIQRPALVCFSTVMSRTNETAKLLVRQKAGQPRYSTGGDPPFLTSSQSGSILFMTLSSSNFSVQIMSLSCILSVEFQTQGLSHTRQASTLLLSYGSSTLLHTDWSPVYPVGYSSLKLVILLLQPPKQSCATSPGWFFTCSLSLK